MGGVINVGGGSGVVGGVNKVGGTSSVSIVVTENILSMFVTREISHFDMSQLNFPSTNMSTKRNRPL